MDAKEEVAVFEEIEQIHEKHGQLTPGLIVEFAKGKKTALHGRFEWNDATASHLYRLRQARDILRVFVKIEGSDGGPIRVRAFVSLPSDRLNGHAYRRIEDVLANPKQREELLAMALTELRAFQKKYQVLTELVGVHSAISKIIDKRKKAVPA